MERAEQVLEIVGNETRRRILAVLSEGPHYILEVSKKLDVTQPAILKHLALLERVGLVESFMKASRFGAPRKYYKICDSVNLEVVINPRDFRVVKHPSTISCPTYIHSEEVMRELADEINKAKDLNEKVAKARNLIREADMLLSCKRYGEEHWNCRNCHKIASLRKRVSEIVIHMSKGDIISGIQALTSVMDLT
ncbi:MAG: Helix-turn-helix domain protein [Candidatus Bathyarchaeota archaeon BA1]|nr:MAG: Helix-turn-helix domain protein [Candidatus Bathyarchaeota archaeon BA1]